MHKLSVFLMCHEFKKLKDVITELDYQSEGPWFDLALLSDRLVPVSTQPENLGTWGFPRKTKAVMTGAVNQPRLKHAVAA